MNLARFIRNEMDSILAEWEAFARTMTPAATGMTPLALRDHAREILHAVALDLATPQTEYAQAEKSKGRAHVPMHARETAAQTHAVLRAKSGFDINQLAAEYRALRASVLRLWMETRDEPAEDFDDVVRFNEAIDQSLTESIRFFSEQVDRARDLLLGMLGHDMRTPLNGIMMTAELLTSLDAGPDVTEAAASLVRGGRSMKALLDDLVDFNRTNLGLGIEVTKSEVDLGAICLDELLQQRAGNPGRTIDLTVNGDLRGSFDGRRMQQVVRNLVSNAIKYGAKDSPVSVTVTGTASEMVIGVKNFGPAIPPETFGVIFDPLRRGSPQKDGGRSAGGLGLGLYIVREVARAHRGDVAVESDTAATVFKVRIPRRASGP